MSVSDNDWQTIFKSIKTTCNENKLKEFHFKFVYRIIVTKKELLRSGIKEDNECFYYGDPDSTDHSLLHGHFTKVIITKCNSMVQ